MESKDLKSIAGVANSISYLFYYPELIKNAVEQEKLVVEIATIARVTPNEVKEFYKLHQRFSLPYIKQAVSLCGELDPEKMEKAIIEQIRPKLKKDGK